MIEKLLACREEEKVSVHAAGLVGSTALADVGFPRISSEDIQVTLGIRFWQRMDI